VVTIGGPDKIVNQMVEYAEGQAVLEAQAISLGIYCEINALTQFFHA
jgi:hypothetical protein